MQSKLKSTSLAFGIISMFYNAAYGVLFGFLINILIALISAATNEDGTWAAIFLFGGYAVLATVVVNFVALFLVKTKPLISGVLFSITGVVVLAYSVLTLIKMFAPLTLVLDVLAVAFTVIALATSFAAHKEQKSGEPSQEEQTGETQTIE